MSTIRRQIESVNGSVPILQAKGAEVCLTLRNALVVLDHQDGRPPVSGYTRAQHHIGHIDPGDYWLPRLDQSPHTVTMMHRKGARMILIDQFGMAYSYSADAILTTAVFDPRTTPRRQDQGSQSAR